MSDGTPQHADILTICIIYKQILFFDQKQNN